MENVLTIHNDFSYLSTANQDIKKLLWEKLRFRQKNYYHTRAYQAGIWDGFIDFFNKKTGKFLTGLLPEVEFALQKFTIPYVIKDERKLIPLVHNSIDANFLHPWTPKGTKQLTLYDYQVDLVNQALRNRRGIVQAPPGAGKTEIMIAIMKALPPVPTLFLVNRTSLVVQNYKRISKWGFDKVGQFYGKVHKPNLITCATVQSIDHLDKLLPHFRAVIADEIHMLSNNSGIKAFKKLKGCDFRIAVSATPFKFGEKDKVQKYTIKGYFGPVFKTTLVEGGKLTTDFLQDRDTLSEATCTFYPIDKPSLPYDLYIDAVTNGIANNIEFHRTVTRLAKSLKGRTLILVERLVHGDALHAMIPGSLWIRGQDDQGTREYAIEQLCSANSAIAIATKGIFDAGINVFIHNLINAAGGQAEHEIVQRIGRGLRTIDDKDILRYFDFMFTNNPYLEDHSKQRVKLLKKEKQEVIVKDSIDF